VPSGRGGWRLFFWSCGDPPRLRFAIGLRFPNLQIAQKPETPAAEVKGFRKCGIEFEAAMQPHGAAIAVTASRGRAALGRDVLVENPLVLIAGAVTPVVEISESDRFSRVFLAKKLACFSIDQMYPGAGFARHCLVLRIRDIVFFTVVRPVLNVQLGQGTRAHKGSHATSVLYVSDDLRRSETPELRKSGNAALSLA
jgi:hypothetical protein